jgi:hypothetical protein
MCARINIARKTDKPLVIPEHLQDIYLRSSTKLTESEIHKFTELLIKYQDAFSKSATYIGFTDPVQHKINTGTALPIRQPIRRLPFGTKEIGMYLANQRGRKVQQQISKDHDWLKMLPFIYPRGGC